LRHLRQRQGWSLSAAAGAATLAGARLCAPAFATALPGKYGSRVPAAVSPVLSSHGVVSASSASDAESSYGFDTLAIGATAGAVLAISKKTQTSRTARHAEKGGIFNKIGQFFGIGQESKSQLAAPPPDPSIARVVITSAQAFSQPFCGIFEEQPLKLHGRTVFMKLNQPANSQPVYLLFNDADQWAITPHTDVRPDGWAFVKDDAMDPWDIKGEFGIWSGTEWVTDATLRARNANKPLEEQAQQSVPVTVSNAAAEQQANISAAAAAPAAAADVAPVEEKQAADPPNEATTLPNEMEDLALLHWKSHWKSSQRALIKWPSSDANLKNRVLPSHPGVHRGVLPNGLRYVILKNAMPPKRFEAHIELHVGSVDEEPHQQGIAHMMEHVCFLGSRKRERLIGTGSRSNALTDFQHTIYHIHAPVQLEDGRGMFLPALEALNEIAFAPEMLPHRIEKERKAVLAEMQQVNDMEYRIETWTLCGLHETNKLGTQFPIGKEEQIKSWQQKDLRAFHESWYYPGNATLYVVGDISEEEMIKGIKDVFGPAPARHEPSPGVAALEPIWGEESADARSLFRRKIAGHRPEQLHNFSVPMIGTDHVFTDAASFNVSAGQMPWHGPVRIFRNELLEGLQVNFYAKAPVRPLRTLEDIKHLIAVRILIGVLQFRIVSRYSSNHAPVTIDHSDSFREGCAVTSITVNADPRDWRNALACVVQEVRAICDYGITESDMNRYVSAMLKDVEKGVTENDTVPSEDHLNFILTSDVFDHVVMHPDQSYQAFKEVVPMVTMEHVHVTAKWMLGFLGYYGQATAPPTTAIVVCTPTQIFDEGTGQWIPFDITENEIVDQLLHVPDKSKEEALNQVEVPTSLLTDHLDKLLANQPIDAATAWRETSRKHDEATGITQMMLPNGARVNYACTANESQGTLRILVPGGRSVDEPHEPGAAMVGIRTVSESGAVGSFSREQVELFAVSNLMSVHLDLNLEFSYVDATYSLSDNGLVALLELLHLLFQEPRWELPAFVRAQQAYKASSYAVQKSLEKSTMDRLMRMMYHGDPRVYELMPEDVKKLTLSKVRSVVAAQLRPQDLEINLVADFDGRGQHKLANVEGGLSTGKHRDGDEEEEEIEIPAQARERKLRELDEHLWRYIGSLPASEVPQQDIHRAPVIAHGEAASPENRQRVAHLEDSDERAVANIGGGAPNRWGKGDKYHTDMMKAKSFSWDTPASPLKDHPLYPSTCLLAMREVINTRLFATVRDSLGLSYDCSFELSMFDRLEAGWYTCTVSTHPTRIEEAVNAAKDVLQGLRRRPISEHELSTARRTLLRRHETDLQNNEYWISLLTHLQYDNPKDVTCVRDIESLFKQLTWRDLQNAYNTLLTDPEQLFVSITTAGPGASYVSGGAAPASASTQNAQKQLMEVD